MDLLLVWLALLAEGNIAHVFLIAAILVLTLTMLLRLYRYQARNRRQTSCRLPARHVQPDPRGLRAGAPDSVVQWEVEMHQLARDLKGEIDSKMVALGHLIRDADRAAGRLEKAIDAARQVAPHTEDADKSPADESRPPEKAGLRDEACLLADYGFSVGDIASRLAIPAGEVELILRLREQKE
ncbi:MAG: hypothetical protein GXX96_29840 [Planctomycetaceae bacterium]|nr:hypothetical protein [Planctomycetaceae bacterium]